MNHVAIIVGSVTAIIYFFYILSKRRANDRRVKEKMKYVGYSDADLNKMHRDELKKIASDIAELRKDQHRLNSVTSWNTAFKTKDALLTMSHNVGHAFNSIEHFEDYEAELKKLRLELEAESITKDRYDKQIINAHEKLLYREWNIGTTSLYSAERLYKLKLISEKELMVVKKRVSDEEEEKELKKQKREREEKTLYINYIKHSILPE